MKKETVDISKMSDDEFIKAHGRLVYSMVNKRYGNVLQYIEESTGYGREDLEQLGFIGLLKARDKFKPEFGNAFSTYAVPLIIGEIQRWLRDSSKIKISRSIHELRNKIIKADMYSSPTAEIATKFEVSEDDVKLAIAYNPAYYHFNSLVANGDSNRDISFEETLPDSFELDEYVAGNESIAKFFKERLSEKERQVWYLYNVKDLGQTETAKMVGVSQVQISRILKKIELKAVEYGKAKGLRT